jgi:hypothetical protein
VPDAPPGRRPSPRVAMLRQDGEAGFIVRFIALIALVIAASWVVSLLPLAGIARYMVPAVGAGLLAAAFIWRPAEALLGFALLILFYDTLAIHLGGTFKQLDELALACFAIIAFVRIASRWRSWVWLPRDASIATVVVIGVVSSIAADVPPGTWVPGLMLSLKGVLFFYVVLWTPFRFWEVAAGMRIVLAVGLSVLALGVVELLAPRALQQAFGLPDYERTRAGLAVVKSVFVHPVLFAWFMGFVALFAFAQFVVTRRWRWLLVGLVFTAGPFLAVRRRAILALVAGLGAGFVESAVRIRRPRELIRAWVPVAAGLALVVAIFSSGLVGLVELTVDRYLPDIGEPAPTVAPGDPSLPEDTDENPQARIALYEGSVAVARDHLPLGGGFGRYGSWMSRVDYSPLYEEYGLSRIHGLRPSNPRFATDTFWPQVLGETGVIGLAGYIGFIGSIAFVLWREAGRAAGAVHRVVRVAAGMALGQALVESLASAMFSSPPRMYLLFLVIGLVVSTAWRRQAGESVDGGGEPSTT